MPPHLCYSLNNFSPSGPSSEAITATFLKYSSIGPNLFEAQEQKAETVHHLSLTLSAAKEIHILHTTTIQLLYPRVTPGVCF